jgi:hypothetical protein
MKYALRLCISIQVSTNLSMHTITFSQSDTNNPPPACQCTDCGHLVQPTVCKSNRNGNAGHYYTKCDIQQANGTQCNYFCWALPKNSPSPSSTQAPSPTIPDTNMATVSTLVTLPAASQALSTLPIDDAPSYSIYASFPSIPDTTRCAVPNCTSKHIAPGCAQ